jgi:NAD(P)H-hydrate epimerase
MIEKALKAEQALFLDRKAIYRIGIPRIVLMENAGRNVADFISSRTREGDRVVIFAGTGYNGGDALVSARHLFLQGRKVIVYVVGNLLKLKSETVIQLRILNDLGVGVINIEKNFDEIKIKTGLKTARFIVDGLLGTGATGILRSPIKEVVAVINSVKIKKVAIDIPTGIDCNSGQPLGDALKADYTITFKVPKRGMFSYQGKKYCGKIFITQIGG